MLLAAESILLFGGGHKQAGSAGRRPRSVTASLARRPYQLLITLTVKREKMEVASVVACAPISSRWLIVQRHRRAESERGAHHERCQLRVTRKAPRVRHGHSGRENIYLYIASAGRMDVPLIPRIIPYVRISPGKSTQKTIHFACVLSAFYTAVVVGYHKKYFSSLFLPPPPIFVVVVKGNIYLQCDPFCFIHAESLGWASRDSIVVRRRRPGSGL